MDIVSAGERLRADEVLDELQGLGQVRRVIRPPIERPPVPDEARRERFCGLEEAAGRTARAQKRRMDSLLAEAAQVIPAARRRRDVLLNRARAARAAAEEWERKAKEYGRICRPG